MSNVSQNLINISMAPLDLEAIMSALTEAEALLPEGGTLTPEQRISYGAINVDNRNFADDVLAEMTTNLSTIIPAFFDPTFLTNDLTLYDQLELIASRLLQTLLRVSDLKRVVGHEAYGFALGVYAIYQMGAKVGMPGAQASVDNLKPRFEGQGTTPDPLLP